MSEMSNATISDVNKEVINKTPYQVEVCTNQTVRNDTTDMIVMHYQSIIGNQTLKCVRMPLLYRALTVDYCKR